MTRGRHVVYGEHPRFGSVWTYGEPEPESPLYVALGVTAGWLKSIRILPPGGGTGHIIEVEDSMLWRQGGTELPNWICIDEGPDP